MGKFEKGNKVRFYHSDSNRTVTHGIIVDIRMVTSHQPLLYRIRECMTKTEYYRKSEEMGLIEPPDLDEMVNA